MNIKKVDKEYYSDSLEIDNFKHFYNINKKITKKNKEIYQKKKHMHVFVKFIQKHKLRKIIINIINIIKTIKKNNL
jgi:hypothetical protein